MTCRLISLLTLIVIPGIVLCSSQSASAQSISVGDPVERYLRLFSSDENLSNLPSFQLRPVILNSALREEIQSRAHPWQNQPWLEAQQDGSPIYNFSFGGRNLSDNISFYQPRFFTSYNTNRPAGVNDGALWQGRGLNSSLSFGGFFSYGPFKASIRPELIYSQNRDFDLSSWGAASGFSQFAVPRTYSSNIDRPQRFGTDPRQSIQPGNSWIRFEYRNFTTGVSTENIWTGPAIHNPIIFSNNAPGFLHAFVGTKEPAKTPIGNFHGRLIWGGLRESDYFDSESVNDLRFINALVFNYSPSFIPGFHVGAARTITKYYPADGLTAPDLFEVFQPFLKENFVSEDNPRGNLGSHQLLSLFGRWQFPSYDMEFYVEWSRNDHSGDIGDFIRHPGHARAYVLGFLKKFDLSPRRWLVTNMEIAQLEVPRLNQFRRTGSYYENGEIIQGFTHNGQVLGASIGPGSNSQIIDVRYYEPRGLLGLSLNRIAHQNDLLFRYFDRGLITTHPRNLHQIEMRLGLHTMVFLPYNLELQVDLYQSKFYNDDFQYRMDSSNTNLQLSLRYNLPGLVR